MTVIGRRSASGRGGGEGAARGPDGFGGWRRFIRPEIGDRLHQAFAGPAGQANLFKVSFCDVRQDVEVNIMRPKGRFVLAEADPLQPLADILGRASHGLAG
jgi:hypothetical protein